MRSWIWTASSVALVVAVLVGACGGTAIVDPPDGLSDGGSSTSTPTSTSSSGGSTSVSSGCDCSVDGDCPDNFECSKTRCDDCTCVVDEVVDGTSCGSGVCVDGQCVACIEDDDCGPGAICAGGSCVGDLFAVCDVTCTALSMCMGGGPGPECFDACAMDLGDCSDTQIAEVAKCADILLQSCDLQAWIDCMEDVGCLDF